MAATSDRSPKTPSSAARFRCGPTREVTAATNGARRHAEPFPNLQLDKDIPMAQIGTFKRTKTGLSGRIRTLALDAELILVPVDKRDAESAPDYRIHLGVVDGSEAGPEVGAGWKRTGEKAGDYISL